MSRLKADRCVYPRVGWLWIAGDGFSGGNYRIIGWGPRRLRNVERSSIVCDAFAMAYATEVAGGLPATLGGIWAAKFRTVAIYD